MSRTVVQIPVSTDLRNSAQKMALSQGFSSLQEAMRVIMHKFSVGSLRVDVYSEPPAVRLSPKAVARYNKMDEDMAKGKGFESASSASDLLNKLGYERD